MNSQGVGRWLAGGSPVTLAASSQSQVKAVFDGEGGAIFTWTDGRGGIYAQRIFSDGSLPVQLASYSGIRLAPGSVLISWTTTSEVNNYGFITERRLRGAELWSEVPNSFVVGHGTTNLPHDYSYTDNTAPVSTSQYRLKQVDLDGTVHCSEPIEIGGLMSVPVSAPKQFLLSQNYPNPFNPTTTIRFRLPASLGGAKQEVHASLKVFDLLGRNVITLIDGMQKPGDYSVTLNANKLASGVYMYRLQAGELVETKKLTVLR